MTCDLMEKVPGFILDAGDARRGKSLPAEPGRIIARGLSAVASISAQKTDNEENRKAEVSVALAGMGYFHADELAPGEKGQLEAAVGVDHGPGVRADRDHLNAIAANTAQVCDLSPSRTSQSPRADH